MTDLPIPAEQSPSELRQSTRLDAIPELYRKTHERLAVELALGVDDAEAIFGQYGYSPEQAATLLESPAFLTLLQQATKEIQETGLSFRTKAKLLAGELLPYANDIATDPLQSAAVRAQLIIWSAKIAGFEPKEKEDLKGAGSGFTLSITFAGSAPTQIISGNQSQGAVSSYEPLTIENEK